jgi:hypothetical protein
VFHRLWWLAEQSPLYVIEVWEVNMPGGGGALGRSGQRHPGGEHVVLIDSWVAPHGGSYERLDQDPAEYGEVVVHELVIHHFRAVTNANAPNRSDVTVWGVGGEGGHVNYPFHSPLATGQYNSSSHILPDTEGDLLLMYLRDRPPIFFHITPEQQRQHDRYFWDLRRALIGVSHANPAPPGSLSQLEYERLRIYCPNPAGSNMRVPGPGGG